VYCGDVMRLQSADNGQYLSSATENESIRFADLGFTKITVMDPNLFLNVPLLQQLNYGDPIVVIQNQTSLVMMRDENGDRRFKWLLRLTPDFSASQTFYLVSADGKELGDAVHYGDSFYVYRNGQVSCAVLDPKNELLLDYGPGVEHAKYEGLLPTFKFVRASPLYSCIDGKCSEVDITEVKYDGAVGTYFGSPVYRDKDCFMQCAPRAQTRVSAIVEREWDRRWIILGTLVMHVILIALIQRW
jgi:hypothetical protein